MVFFAPDRIKEELSISTTCFINKKVIEKSSFNDILFLVSNIEVSELFAKTIVNLIISKKQVIFASSNGNRKTIFQQDPKK